MAASPSAANWATAPARVTGGHGPGEGERGDHGGLAAAREPHRAVEHRPVVLERGGRVDVGVHPRLGLEFLVRETARDPGHLHHVVDPLRAQRIGVHHLVGEVQLVVEAVEVAHRGVNIQRLHRVAAGEVDAVEVLGELEEVPVALAVADAPAAVEVRAVGRARHVAEDDVPPADGDPPLRVAGGDGELGRRELHLLHHELAVHAHVGAVRARLAPGGGENRASLLVQELDADLFQDPHRAVVHGVDLLFGERLGGGIRVDGDLPGKLRDRGPRTAAVRTVPSHPPAPPPRGSRTCFGGHPAHLRTRRRRRRRRWCASPGPRRPGAAHDRSAPAPRPTARRRIRSLDRHDRPRCTVRP